MLVYKATNLINGKVYVGKTVRSLSHAKARHKLRAKGGCVTKLYNSMRKHGFDNFSWEVAYRGCSNEDICMMEVTLIRELQCRDSEFGYNMTDGGEGTVGAVVTEELRSLMSERSSGENNPCFGLFGEQHPAYGNRHTDDAKKRISEAHKGKPKSEETKRKLSQARLANSKYSYETRRKAYLMRESGSTYQSIADELDITTSAVAYKIVKKFKSQYATVQTTSE